MGENSKIQWTDHTFNPWIGCTKVSPGCENCYAERLSARYKWSRWGRGEPRKLTARSNWRKPIAWDRKAGRLGIRYRVFCASLADWLDPEVDISWLWKLQDLIDDTPNLDWMMLTKRPELFRPRVGYVARNMWLGVSAENQEQWDKRVPILLDLEAPVRFVSVEPMLDAIDPKGLEPDLVIVGGESGPGARPMYSGWVQDLAQALPVKTKFFFKQRGANYHGTPLSSMQRKEIPGYAS